MHAHATYLPLAHVQQGGPVAGCSGQLALKKFPVEKAPRTAVFPWQRLATHVIDEERRVDTSHEERRQLHAAGVHLLHLADTRKRNISASRRCGQRAVRGEEHLYGPEHMARGRAPQIRAASVNKASNSASCTKMWHSENKSQRLRRR